MKILSEEQGDNGTYILDVEFEDGELDMLVNYAVNDILKKQVESEERKGKSYCNQCKYIKRHASNYYCDAPQNRKDTWLEKASLRDFMPSVKNKDNDCEWYRELSYGFQTRTD